jgi:hypothetical protein
MKYVRLIGFVTLVPFTLGLTAAPVLAASAKPADQPFRLSVLLDEKNGLERRRNATFRRKGQHGKGEAGNEAFKLAYCATSPPSSIPDGCPRRRKFHARTFV